MNGTEQRQRHSAVQNVEAQVENICELLAQMAGGLKDLDARGTDIAKTALAAIDDVMTALETETEHRVALGAIVRGHQAFVQRTLWQRLRWLVRGV